MNNDEKTNAPQVDANEKEGKLSQPKAVKMPLFAKLSKKVKVIILSCLAILLISVGVLLAVLLPKQETPTTQPPKVLYVSEYQYGIIGGDTQGIKLASGWMQTLPFSAFRVTTTSDSVALSLSDDMILVADATDSWATAEIIFYYKNNKITTYKIDILPLENAVNITSEQGFNSILPNTKQRYVLKNDISLSSSVSIKNFGGAFYGNYFVIDGLDISASGGLFDSVSSAYVSGINLKNVQGNITLTENNHFGVLANKATLSRFINCSAEGQAEVATGTQGYYYIGGLFGQIVGHSRKENADNTGKSLYEGCKSNIALIVDGGGELYIGGIAGGVTDAAFANCESTKDIRISADNFTFIYAGGIAGVMERKYSTPLKITYYDSSYGIKSSGNIYINSQNTTLLDRMYIGGIFGYTKNTNTSSATAVGDINIVTMGASVMAGGFAGKCENEFAKEGVELKITSADIKGELNIDSSGNIYAGGLIGFATGGKKTKTEKTVSVPEPNIIAPNASRIVEIGANIGHTED